MSRSPTASTPRLLTVARAAEHLGTTTSAFYELIARRAVPSVRIGRAIRIAKTTSTDSPVEPATPRPQLATPITSARAVSTPSASSRIAAVAMTPSVDGAAPQYADRAPRPSRCPNAATARRTPAHAVSRTPLRPPGSTQTCTPVRPVDASTRSPLGRRGHEPA